MARTAAPETWGHSTVRTACPLDCPDACTLDVTVENGRVAEDRRRRRQPRHPQFHLRQGPPLRRAASTARTACSIPSVRQGAEGRRARYVRVTWDEALDLIARRMLEIKEHGRRRGDPPLLLRRLERPAHAEHQRRRAVAALRHVAPGDDDLRRADRRRQPRRSTARCRRVVYQDYPARQADHPLGRQPVGLGHPPRPVHQGSAGRRRDARRDRPADDVAREDRRTCTSPCGPAPTCRSRSRCTA